MQIKKSFISLISLCLFLNAYSQQDSIPSIISKDTLYANKIERNTSDKIYKLKPIADIPIVVIGGGWSAFAFSKIYSKDPSTEEEILNLKKSNIPSFDRWAAGKTNKQADINSDYLFYGTIPVPFTLLADKEIRHDAAKIGFMYLEAMAITGLIYSGTVYFIDRYRPETYNTTIPVKDRTSGNNKDAFIAGHPALVATGMFFTAKIYADYHPDSKLKYGLYGLAIAATGTTAYLRHIAGKHFPSDLLAGITVGTLSGILVPQFHKNKKIVDQKLGFMPFTNGRMHGFAMTYQLK